MAAPGRAITGAINSLAQFFANRGYAVLMPNFRGSTGYGKELPERGQRRMGPQDAGRRHLGREISDRRRHRRSQAHRDSGRFVWRLHHARRCGVHARCVSRGRRHRRSVESTHPARSDSAVLGGRTQDHVRPHGGPGHAARESVDGGAFSSQFRQQNQDAL